MATNSADGNSRAAEGVSCILVCHRVIRIADTGRSHSTQPERIIWRGLMGIGARNHPVADALRFIDLFVSTPFSNEPRHVRRIGLLTEYETTGSFG